MVEAGGKFSFKQIVFPLGYEEYEATLSSRLST